MSKPILSSLSSYLMIQGEKSENTLDNLSPTKSIVADIQMAIEKVEAPGVLESPIECGMSPSILAQACAMEPAIAQLQIDVEKTPHICDYVGLEGSLPQITVAADILDRESSLRSSAVKMHKSWEEIAGIKEPLFAFDSTAQIEMTRTIAEKEITASSINAEMGLALNPTGEQSTSNILFGENAQIETTKSILDNNLALFSIQETAPSGLASITGSNLDIFLSNQTLQEGMEFESISSGCHGVIRNFLNESQTLPDFTPTSEIVYGEVGNSIFEDMRPEKDRLRKGILYPNLGLDMVGDAADRMSICGQSPVDFINPAPVLSYIEAEPPKIPKSNVVTFRKATLPSNTRNRDTVTSVNVQLLEDICPFLVEMYEGAHDAFEGANADRVSHILVSLRRFWDHFIKKLCPDNAVIKFIGTKKKHLTMPNGEPTRRAKCLYLYRGVANSSSSKFVENDSENFKIMWDFFNLLHEPNTRLSQRELKLLLIRTNFYLASFLNLK